MRNKFIKEMLTSNVICVSPDAYLPDVISLMRKKNISCVVITQDRKPLGIFTERDIVKTLCKNSDFKNLKINEIMTKSVLTAKEEINIYELYDLLINNNIRHLIIVDNKNNIVGIITQTDIINNLGLEYFFEVKDIAKIMTRNVKTVTKKNLLRDVIVNMADNAVSCIVVAENNKPVGIFTERDVVYLYNKGIDLKNITVNKVMSSPAVTVTVKTPLFQAVKLMSNKKIRRLVVVDDKGFIVGLMTQHDIVKGLEARYIQFLKDIIHKKEEIIKETKNDLIEKTVYLENILSSSKNLAIIATNLDFRILYYNQTAEKVFGYKINKILNMTLKEILRKEKLEDIRFNRAMELINNKGDYDFTIEQKKIKGNYFIESRLSGIWDKNNKLMGYVLISRDITERKKVEQRLEYMAHYDLLTNIPNRALFFDRLNHALNEAKREKLIVGLLFIDLDGFKKINDTMGHHCGDLVLKRTANRLKKCIRKSDTVARVSGDEFAIILNKIKKKEDAAIVAKKVLKILSNALLIYKKKISVSASIGISVQLPDEESSEKKLLMDADTAMYRVKAHGKENFSFF
ncbi:diguanylate cyclase [Candidatus Poribacteria bacterium]|nr:diguanylate cyclase [Candidatus Poribacteria bacterium]